MFNFNNADHKDALKKVISDLLVDIDGMDSTSKEYGGSVDNLIKLVKLQNDTTKLENDVTVEDTKLNHDYTKMESEQEKIAVEREKLLFEQAKFEFEKEKSRSWKPSPDAIVAGAVSILGIVAILKYEKVGVVTSKALSFVGRGLR